MVDDRVIAARPHPLGAKASVDVRDFIFARMAAEGLHPRRLPGEAVESPLRAKGTLASGGAVENLLGVLPGRDPTAGAILLMAHSDSVPASPGAADDAAGVAAALEVARALKSEGPQLRSVFILITDGEEAGLLGARAFFASGDPVLRQIGEVVNMEARGGGGRVGMFETGEKDGAAIDLFAKAVPNTDALSLMSEVYKYLPNSTDFTVTKKAGYPGYNFAFWGEEFDYHSPSSTPQALDQGSVQHMGDQVLPLVRALADADVLPPARPDAIYADILGGPVIAYPPLIGWLVVALCAGLAAAGLALSKPAARLADTLRGAAAAVCQLLETALVLHLANRLIDPGALHYRSLLAQFPLVFAAMAALAVAVSLWVWRVAFRGKGRWRLSAAALAAGLALAALGPMDGVGLALGIFTAILALSFTQPLKPMGGWFGGVAVGILLTLVLQGLAPPLSVATAWPALLASLAFAAVAWAGRGSLESRSAIALAGGFGFLACAQLGHLSSLIFTSIGMDWPEALASVPFLAALVLFPLIEGLSRGRVGAAATGVLGLVALAALGLAAVRDPATTRTPRPVQAFFLDDAVNGRAWGASTLDRLDPWSRAAMGAPGPASVRKAALEPLFSQVNLVPAAPIDLQRPSFEVHASNEREGREMSVTVTARGGGREARLFLQPSEAIQAVEVNGLLTALKPQPGRWAQLRWAGLSSPLRLSFVAKGHGSLDVRYVEIIDGWPKGRTPPVKPPATMGWGISDSTILMDQTTVSW